MIFRALLYVIFHVIFDVPLEASYLPVGVLCHHLCDERSGRVVVAYRHPDVLRFELGCVQVAYHRDRDGRRAAATRRAAILGLDPQLQHAAAAVRTC